MKRGVTFLYFGSMYDIFFEKADRVIAVRNGHLGGCFELQERSEELFNKMVYAGKRTSGQSVQREKSITDGQQVMSIQIEEDQDTKQVLIREKMTISIEADSQTCESLSRLFHQFAKRAISKIDLKLQNTVWLFEKTYPYDMCIIPFELKRDLICEDQIGRAHV